MNFDIIVERFRHGLTFIFESLKFEIKVSTSRFIINLSIRTEYEPIFIVALLFNQNLFLR